MAQQDVRYYLNGMLLETEGKTLRAVATDGHRLALCEAQLPAMARTAQQVIVPRKGVLELQRILGPEGNVELAIGTNHVRAQIGEIRFTSKLIDGRFPEYGRVVPANPTKKVHADRDLLRQAFQRTAILSNEKYRGIRLTLKSGLLTVQAHNPEQEEAEDQLEVRYEGEDLEIGFNVNYLLDALAALDGETVEIGLSDANSSCLVRLAGFDGHQVRRDADAAVGPSRSTCSTWNTPHEPGSAVDSESALPAPGRTGPASRAQSHRRRERFGQDLAARGHLPAGPRPLFPHPEFRAPDYPGRVAAGRVWPHVAGGRSAAFQRPWASR